ncbi:MAG: RNA polymerase sigma factor [Chitinophagaceae bacterium]|nr:MAG: RNA polymerase sigma factor [Chitinophagaceae bacterium]
MEGAIIHGESLANLIKKSFKNDRKSQRILYEYYSPVMFSICLRYAGDYHKAEDYLQEGFVRAFQNLHQFSFKGSFDGWLKRIFVNTCISELRSSVAIYPLIEVKNIPDENDTDDFFYADIPMEKILKMIQELPVGYRTIFNLYTIDGLSHDRISVELNISVGTSKSQLARARVALQKKLKQLDIYPKEKAGR